MVTINQVADALMAFASLEFEEQENRFVYYAHRKDGEFVSDCMDADDAYCAVFAPGDKYEEISDAYDDETLENEDFYRVCEEIAALINQNEG